MLKLEQEYTEALNKLAKKKKKLSMKNKFIGTLTHEMRNYVARYSQLKLLEQYSGQFHNLGEYEAMG